MTASQCLMWLVIITNLVSLLSSIKWLVSAYEINLNLSVQNTYTRLERMTRSLT